MDTPSKPELLDELKDIHSEVDGIIDRLSKEIDEYESTVADAIKSLGDTIDSTDGQLEAIEAETAGEIETLQAVEE